jgi:hypothetical protein
MESSSHPDRSSPSGELRIFALEESGTTLSESRAQACCAGSRHDTDCTRSRCDLERIHAHEFGQYTYGVCNPNDFSSDYTAFKFEFRIRPGYHVATGSNSIFAQHNGTGRYNARSLWYAQPGEYGSSADFFNTGTRDYPGWPCGSDGEPEFCDDAARRNGSCEPSSGRPAECGK